MKTDLQSCHKSKVSKCTARPLPMAKRLSDCLDFVLTNLKRKFSNFRILQKLFLISRIMAL